MLKINEYIFRAGHNKIHVELFCTVAENPKWYIVARVGRTNLQKFHLDRCGEKNAFDNFKRCVEMWKNVENFKIKIDWEKRYA